ncbi:MAG: hypothetical protein K6T61_05030 [Bryobacteraceae bacterium]|nr:hypothetical protein [Bryobacteraceae bacterium]
MDRLRIVVLGYVVRGPLGGLSWHPAQYLTGLLELGHDAVFLEDSGDDPWCCYDPSRHATDSNPAYGLRYAAGFFQRLGAGERWAYYDAHRGEWCGPLAPQAPERCRTADVVLNISGINPLRHGLENAPYRVYVDTDPVFTQIRNLQEPDRRALTHAHNRHFSFGENISNLPADGFSWRPTRQPVDLRFWPVTPAPSRRRFTTVMQWESYPCREHQGRVYGMKSLTFPEFLNLPSRVRCELEAALGGPSVPLSSLLESGWRLANPLEVTATPWTFRGYIQASAAEFSVAKHGYVVSSCGWFSDRSAAYLASGRPVVVQDTGFQTWLHAAGGVLPFRTPEEAASAIHEVDARYRYHSQLARSIAEEYFAAEKVLTRLLEQALENSD